MRIFRLTLGDRVTMLQRYISFLCRYFRFFLMPLIPLYLAIFYIKKMLSHPQASGMPVICIGNITVGGTGKTPAVMQIVKLLEEEEYKPAIVSRGYRGSRSKVGAIVCDGAKILLNPEESGDESYLMALRLKNIPIAIGHNRLSVVLRLMRGYDIDVIIMDDGIQNNSIYKEISIITIDATNPFGNGLILPAGDLREPKSALKRADLILITKSDLISEIRLKELEKRIKRISAGCMIFKSKYKISEIYRIDDNDFRYPVSAISDKRVLLITAIGNPEAFLKTVIKYKPDVVRLLPFPDHYNYTERDCDRFVKESNYYDYVLVTEKDYVKMKKYHLNPKFFVLPISVAFEYEPLFRKHLLHRLSEMK